LDGILERSDRCPGQSGDGEKNERITNNRIPTRQGPSRVAKLKNGIAEKGEAELKKGVSRRKGKTKR
jgi:hypothetical protein